jgi:hypothetical protein
MSDNLDASFFTDADDLTKLLEDERDQAVIVSRDNMSTEIVGPWKLVSWRRLEEGGRAPIRMSRVRA